jgi:hypothetical protein
MADNGKASGSGKTSPYGATSGAGGKGPGNDFVKNPAGSVGNSRGAGNNFVESPGGSGDKTGGNDFVENPGGDMDVPKQKSGAYSNPASIPAGGKLPYAGTGTGDPAKQRTDPKSGFAAGSSPAGPDRKPFKVGSK